MSNLFRRTKSDYLMIPCVILMLKETNFIHVLINRRYIDNNLLSKTMKKYQKVAINIAFLTMILSTGMTNNYISTFNPDFSSDSDSNVTNQENTKYANKKQEKILNTFETGDYQAWKKIVGQNNKINNVINEFSFQRFVAARVAARNGEYNKALIITEELKKGVESQNII